MKKIISTILVFVVVMALGVTAFADNITTSGGSQSVPVTLNVAPATFSVTIPSSIPVEQQSDGSNIYATNLSIFNHSNGQVDVTDVTVTGQNSYSLVGFTTDFSKKKVDTKEFGFKLCGEAANASTGKVDVSKIFETLNPNSSFNFQYAFNLPMASSAFTSRHIANITFTVAWHTAT